MQEINSGDSNITNSKDLQYALHGALEQHAPLQKEYLGADQQNFMAKGSNQAIMVRSKLRNISNVNPK